MGIPELKNLPADIYRTLEQPGEVNVETVQEFGQEVAGLVASRLARDDKPRLRMSNLGTKCLRKLWYELNVPYQLIPLDGQTRLKFLYGDLVELLVMFLAKLSGHKVEGQQDVVEINGVQGHRDGIIDGVLVDVKSASQYGFKKFREHGLVEDDPFGYLDQINSYGRGSKDDPRVTEPDLGFVAVDKSSGDLVVDLYPPNTTDYAAKIDEIRRVTGSASPPPRAFEDVPEGKSGNRKLGVTCSYCSAKELCWPGLRTFSYAKGPVFLTHVEREPKVVEAEEF